MPSAAKKVKVAGDRSAEALPRLSAVTARIRARARCSALTRSHGALKVRRRAELVGRTSIVAPDARQRWRQGKILGRSR
jgi:hypothetical protein